MLHTTLKLCKESSACSDGFRTLKKSLPKNHSDEDLISLTHIIESNGLEDCLWSLRATIEDSDYLSRSFAIWCARQSLQYWESEYPDDSRVKDCIDTSERFLNGDATEEERSAAGYAAEDAYRSAAEDASRFAAWSAAWSARSAARSASRSAWSAAGSAAGYAARSIAWSAARSIAWYAARSTAWYAAEDATESDAGSTARSAQTSQLIKMLENHEV